MTNITYVSIEGLSSVGVMILAIGITAYIDCLFLCYSASTVTGLTTANLSTCTGFQQALLYI